MPTATDERLLVALTIPVALAKIMEEEAKLTGTAFAPLVRRIIKWHYGAAHGRHPDSPTVTLKKRKTKPENVKKGILVDIADADHLDHLGYRIGLARTSMVLLVILQYFDISMSPPQSKKRT
jgi:hypothetical protein